MKEDQGGRWIHASSEVHEKLVEVPRPLGCVEASRTKHCSSASGNPWRVEVGTTVLSAHVQDLKGKRGPQS